MLNFKTENLDQLFVLKIPLELIPNPFDVYFTEKDDTSLEQLDKIRKTEFDQDKQNVKVVYIGPQSCRWSRFKLCMYDSYNMTYGFTHGHFLLASHLPLANTHVALACHRSHGSRGCSCGNDDCRDGEGVCRHGSRSQGLRCCRHCFGRSRRKAA